MTAALLLYHDTRAPNPRRVRIFLAEKGVAYDTIEVSIAAAEHQKPEFRKKNPLALLPVLELGDGKILRESMAISRYLEELYPEPNLLGADPWERAVIEQWNRNAELEVLFPIAQVFRNTHDFWKTRLEQAPEFGAIMRRVLLERFAWLDGELATRPYLAGDRFTIADITLLCGIDLGRISNVRIDAEATPHLAKWRETVAARPSAKA
jgi:glutathione S-transferase